MIYVYCVQVNGMSISKCGGKWLFVEMWILKDFGQFSGELYGDATTCCKSGDFRADQDSPSGSQGAQPSSNLEQKSDLNNWILISGLGLKSGLGFTITQSRSSTFLKLGAKKDRI